MVYWWWRGVAFVVGGATFRLVALVTHTDVALVTDQGVALTARES